MKQLYNGTFEYGWSHKGVRSWGENWETKARNEALEKIRKKVESMVNLGELETFSKKDLKQSVAGVGSKGKSTSLSISTSKGKSEEERVRWVNANNYLVDISNVQIKPKTSYSKGRDERPLGGRSWEASATMVVELRIFGKE